MATEWYAVWVLIILIVVYGLALQSAIIRLKARCRVLQASIDLLREQTESRTSVTVPYDVLRPAQHTRVCISDLFPVLLSHLGIRFEAPKFHQRVKVYTNEKIRELTHREILS